MDLATGGCGGWKTEFLIAGVLKYLHFRLVGPGGKIVMGGVWRMCTWLGAVCSAAIVSEEVGIAVQIKKHYFGLFLFCSPL